MKQNITLAVEKDLLAKLRLIAAKRSTSISRLLTDELIEIVERTERYEHSKRYALSLLESGFHFGGQRVRRDDLHDR